MRAISGAVLTALLTTASIGLAGPASAEPLSGTYTALFSGNNGSSQTMTWTFTPCGPDCTTMDNGRELHLQNGIWSGSTPGTDGIVCSTTIDAATLSGTHGCGFMTFNFHMTRN